VRRLDHAALQRRLGAPLAGYYLVLTSGDTTRSTTPVRVGTPPLDEGPHFSYAVQWFLFAAIFGAGGTVVVLRGRDSLPSAGAP
jgi:cytochrome oxidase assembly protein ShyY1